MKAQDLDLLELLELRPDEGSIQFKNRRMLLWDAKSGDWQGIGLAARPDCPDCQPGA